jgi:DNA gyrase subunit B
VQLIERGYLYIAQPPLYKVTRNKKDQYLKDESARDAYDLRLAGEHCEILTGQTPPKRFAGEDLKAVLSKIITYRKRLEKGAARRDPRVIDAIVQATRMDESTLSDFDQLNEQIADLEPYLEAHTPDVMAHLKLERRDDPAHQSKKLVIKTEVNGSPRETVLDHAFLTGPEYRELCQIRDVAAQLGPAPYTVKFGEDEVQVKSLQELLNTVRRLATKGVSIQRYKGLGEMNPEQLWETTMNPQTRTLLQVRIEDAVESDDIFSLLMGEAVEPRREFIEKNALEAQNLDI